MIKRFGSEEAVRSHLRKRKMKSFMSVGLGSFFGLSLLAFVVYLGITRASTGPLTKGVVHWHLPLVYSLCGDTTQLPEKEGHWLVHGHGDAKIHVEGVIPDENSIRLGRFFDNSGIAFGADAIGSYKTGDFCPGSAAPGHVRLYVNGEENTLFEDYVMNDGDEIKVVFE